MLRRCGSLGVSRLTVSACTFTALPNLKYPAELPKLSYDHKEGIPPVFSPRQIELHYKKHHQTYVDKLNTLGKGMEGKTVEAIMSSAEGKADQKVLFNQAAQHFNHTFFWNCLKPNGSRIPSELESALVKTFGSVEKFKESFQQSGANNFGSGWTWLCVNPKSKGLEIVNTSNAACPLTDGLFPIFTADVWEHAYYKDFENRRPDYLKELWQVVNWEYVADMYKKACQ